MLSRRMVFLLAFASCVAVANLYYNQPLLELMGRDVHAPASQMGLLATLAQVGYGLGMLLIVPLGDMLERKRLIVGLCLLVAAFNIMMGAAPTLHWMLAASLFIGITTCSPQIMLPYAAALATKETRGRVVGTVMSGLLVGILLSRTVSGFIGEHLGFRVVYYGAAGLMVALALLLQAALKPQHPAARLGYSELVKSLWTLFREHALVRRHTLMGALTFACFSAFWTTLSFHLATPPLHYGGDVAGFYGLVGVAGALVAPLAGKLSDQGGAHRTNVTAIVICALSFVVFYATGSSLIGLGVGVILLDIGVQGNHITNQSRVFGLDAALRSRLNSIYMTGYFGGGACGSALATAAFVHGGWPLVSLLGFTLSCLALATYFFYDPPTRAATAAR